MRQAVDCQGGRCMAVVGWEQSRGRAACFASVRRSALRADFAVLLGLVARRGTRCVRCAHCAQTAATSQTTKRAGARGHEPCAARRRTGAAPAARPRLCQTALALYGEGNGARQASSLPCSGASRARCPRSAFFLLRGSAPLAKPWAGVRRRACAAASSAGFAGGARSALRQLTRRACLSAANAVSEASCATARKPEQHSAVGPQGRPPHRRAAARPPTALLPPNTSMAARKTSATGRFPILSHKREREPLRNYRSSGRSM